MNSKIFTHLFPNIVIEAHAALNSDQKRFCSSSPKIEGFLLNKNEPRATEYAGNLYCDLYYLKSQKL